MQPSPPRPLVRLPAASRHRCIRLTSRKQERRKSIRARLFFSQPVKRERRRRRGGRRRRKKNPQRTQERSRTLQFSHSSLCGGRRNVLCSERSAEGLGHCEFLMSEAFLSCLAQTAAGFHPSDHTPRNHDFGSENGSKPLCWGFRGAPQMCPLPENKEQWASAPRSSERFA